MCRLLGVTSRHHGHLADTVGSLDQLTALSRKHCDGWGAAWRTADGAVATAHSPVAAFEDEAYARMLVEVDSDQVLVHLRRASPGIPVLLENCHPFTEGGVSFAHNGQFPVTERLLAWCEEAGVRPRQGTTDSELYFGLVLHHSRNLPWHEALAAAARQITSDLWVDDPTDDPEALNAILITPEAMYAYAQSQPKKLRPDSETDTYELRMLETDDSVVFASTHWDLPGSRPLPDRHVMQVDRGTLAVTDHGLIPLG